MKRKFIPVIIVLLAGLISQPALASTADEPMHDQPIAGAAEHATDSRHPVLSRDGTWAGVMVIVILGAFSLPAAVIGPVAHSLAPQEEHEVDAHDQHDSSHHHDPGHSAPSH